MRKILLMIISGIMMFGAVFLHSEEIGPKRNADALVLVVNKNSSWATSLTKEKVKDIYLGNIKFENGAKIIPLGQKDETLLKIFVERFLDMTLNEYKTYWVKKVFTEGGSSPKLFDDSHDIIKQIWSNPAVISYLWNVDLTEKENELVKVVTVLE